MLKRLLLGLLKGSLVGGLVAYALVAGLSLVSLSGWTAYTGVVLAGIVTAVVAGRPIWAPGARTEVALKAVAAAVLGCAFLFLGRRYLPGTLAGVKWLELPFVVLPLVSTLLAVFFELDNDGSAQLDESSKDTQTQRLRVEGSELDDSFSQEETVETKARTERR